MSKKRQSKSKTVKSSRPSKQKSPTLKRKLQKVDKRLIAKRQDALGRKYYINTQTGKHVSESEWKREGEKIRIQRDTLASQLVGMTDEIVSPFPAGISPKGVPEKKISFDPDMYEGEAFDVNDFEPYPIEGDDETG